MAKRRVLFCSFDLTILLLNYFCLSFLSTKYRRSKLNWKLVSKLVMDVYNGQLDLIVLLFTFVCNLSEWELPGGLEVKTHIKQPQ